MTARLLVLPPRLAQRQFLRIDEAEIKRRVRWWRFKRWISSREVWLTFVALLLASVFMVGKAFSQEQPGVELVNPREVRLALVIGGLALLLCSLAILDYLLVTDRLGGKKPDEGAVTPKRGRW